MNPNFAQETTADQYLAYDNWLHQERVRNWSAYTAYCEYKQQQQAMYARIQQLRYQYQQQQQLQQQQLQQQLIQQQQQQQQLIQQQQEQLQAEADFQSYIKEIDEIRTELPQESEPPVAVAIPAAYVSTSVDDCWDIPEKFQPTQEKKWRKDLRQDRRRDSKHVVEHYKQVREGIPPAPEVPRAEYFNANKPPRVLRYESAQKRKTKMRQDQRVYSSGWGKQLE